jgi:transcriptional regulator with XRE-family HTH domain
MLDFRTIRLRAQLTQSVLATRSGIRQATISSLENGRSSAHPGTVLALAGALDTPPELIKTALNQSLAVSRPVAEGHPIEQLGLDWAFLEGLDADLRSGLARSLVANWTHSSTALEGNTISAGDTLFVLTEGLTISGKSLREHQELHGHAQALGIMAGWTRARQPIRVAQLHQLHTAVMTGAPIDVFAPVGRWKVEPNGTNAITSKGATKWHDYAEPKHVSVLTQTCLKSLARNCRDPRLKKNGTIRSGEVRGALLDAYTDGHLGFTTIHPYADGNGRIARLLANVPILWTGHPPLLIDVTQRREYITLLGDYSLKRGPVNPAEELVLPGPERDALRDFFAKAWKASLQLVTEFHHRQAAREKT